MVQMKNEIILGGEIVDPVLQMVKNFPTDEKIAKRCSPRVKDDFLLLGKVFFQTVVRFC